MPIISRRVIRDSDDIDIAIVGAVEAGEHLHEIIVKPGEFLGAPKTVKINAMFHSIQSGVVVLFYWEGESDHTLILPLEGRGILDLTRFGGLVNPRYPGWTGNLILAVRDDRSTGSAKHFAISLELSKQRS